MPVWLLVGNWTEAEALYWQALRISQSIDDSQAHARCELALGETLYLKGSYVEALSWLDQAGEIFEKMDDQKGVCDVSGITGRFISGS